MNSEKSVDFLIVGSGAAALSGAIRAHDLGLSVLVVEKTDLFGGNTAMSGGVVWVPNNAKMKRTAIKDSDAEALEYLKHITRGDISDERIQQYIVESNRMLDYLHENTHVHYEPLVKYTDYYPEAPGGKVGGRSMDPQPFDGAKLRETLIEIRKPHPQSQIIGKFGITAKEAHSALGLGFTTRVFMAWQLFLYGLRFLKRKKWGRDTKLCAGNSLVGRLILSAKERGIEMWRNSPLTSLVIENGEVIGAVVQHDGHAVTVRAKNGVLLAAGGFSKNAAMRNQYQRKPITTEWTAGSPGNTGDAITMGIDAGGTVEYMDEAWWTPTSVVPKYDEAWVLVVEKSLPHGIFVNERGTRFTNEAAPYVDVVLGMYADAENANNPKARWFHIFDAEYRELSIAGPIPPSKIMPDNRIPRSYRESYIHRADTLEALCEKIGLPLDAVKATLERFNANAIKGEDPDFGRGLSAQDRYYGHPSVKPNCSLGPVSKAPFYAIEIFPGDLGTKGGLVTDSQCRVMHRDGHPIAGLYAAGNCASPVMGRTYPGAGGTIGPALTYGFLAAESAAAMNVASDNKEAAAQ
ncbi:MAG: FAD-dependent oxidoreductase [Polyangiales bacterium]